jgi:hypothetical protein
MDWTIAQLGRFQMNFAKGIGSDNEGEGHIVYHGGVRKQYQFTSTYLGGDGTGLWAIADGVEHPIASDYTNPTIVTGLDVSIALRAGGSGLIRDCFWADVPQRPRINCDDPSTGVQQFRVHETFIWNPFYNSPHTAKTFRFTCRSRPSGLYLKVDGVELPIGSELATIDVNGKDVAFLRKDVKHPADDRILCVLDISAY